MLIRLLKIFFLLAPISLIGQNTADLSLYKEANNSKFQQNESVIYTIFVKNKGPQVATNIEIVDNLPPQLQFETVNNETLVEIKTENEKITATIKELAVNETISFKIKALVLKDTLIVNTAEITKADQQDPNSTPNNGLDEDDLSKAYINLPVNCSEVSSPGISSSVSQVCASDTFSLKATGCNGKVVWSNWAVGEEIKVTQTENTSYTAICQTSECTSAQSSPLTINLIENYSISIGANKKSICKGDTVTLTALGCQAEAIWSTNETGNSIKSAPSQTTTYTATCGRGACAAEQTLIIEVLEKPNPLITVDKTEISAGETSTLTVSNCQTVVWNTGDTLKTISVSPQQTTNYSATCSNSVCETIVQQQIIVTGTISNALGLAKNLNEITRTSEGNWDTQFLFTITNTSDLDLSSIHLQDNLEEVFGNQISYEVISVNASTGLVANQNYNGNTDINLLVPENSVLLKNETATVTLDLKIINYTTNDINLENSAWVKGENTSLTFEDVSENGLFPDPDNNNNPTDNSEKTLFTVEGVPVNTSTLVIPGGISPNNDGINDTWAIQGITIADQVEIKIYNRQGQMVFKSDNYKSDFQGAQDGWNTKGINNHWLPDGTYYYTFYSKNYFDGKPKTDFITIKK